MVNTVGNDKLQVYGSRVVRISDQQAVAPGGDSGGRGGQSG